MSLVAIATGMWLLGLASSLHCVGMCGPLVLGFARAGGRALPGGVRSAWESVPYHAGRVWTYALLGLLAGTFGSRVAREGVLLEQPLAIAAGALVATAGLTLLAGEGLAARVPGACGRALVQAGALVRSLAGGRLALSRLLLGVVMGFLPCGLVYAMLAVSLTLGSPVRGAVGMAAFGLGTVPALAATLAMAHLLPARLRAAGGRIAAMGLLVAGGWMVVRATVLAPAAGESCEHCVESAPRVEADPPTP